MIFQHHRFQIWNKSQHPYAHLLSELNYSHSALPTGEVQNALQAMDWLINLVYPQTKDSVDTVALLPAAGNVLNDYRVVNDDGDGKAASYRWMQLEGEVTPSWKKVYDMDWGEDSILSNFLLKTQDVYVYKHGIDDLDGSGAAYIGDLAGQRVYGGASAGSHLILHANSGDGVGAQTGFIQLGDDTRPLLDSTYTLGTDTYRFLNFFTDEANVSTMQILGGSITDTSGAIDFADEDLSTTGTVTIDTMLIQGGSITDTSGIIDFADENLVTTGLVSADSGVDVGTTMIRTGGIFITEAASTHNFSFIPDGGGTTFTGTLSATGDLDAKNGEFTDTVTVKSLDGLKEVTVTTVNGGSTVVTSTGALILDPNDDLFVSGSMNVSLNLSVDGIFNVGALDEVEITTTIFDVDNAFTFQTSAGDLTFTPFSGMSEFTSDIIPASDAFWDIGLAATRWEDLYLSGTISDGTDAIAMATLLSFRDSSGTVDGQTLFWDTATSRYLPSLPDTEIDHGAISGLAGDDHLQYALLVGRSGGQNINGGIDASDNLVLDSTAHATKGNIVFSSILRPSADGTLDVGTSSFRLGDIYMAGEGIGFRMENSADFASLPAASASHPGRLAWTLDADTIWVDRGGTWKQITTDKYVKDETAAVWDGVQTVHVYTTSGEIDDARNAVWQFLDNTNSFREVGGAVITKSQTQVTVTFTMPPPSGSYRLVGVG